MTQLLAELKTLGPGRAIWVQQYVPTAPPKGVVFIFPPLLDERKRNSSFQADLARALAEQGFLSIATDYFGTGDSPGAGFEFDPVASLDDAEALMASLSLPDLPWTALGFRFGADFAIRLGMRGASFARTILVEPLWDGRRFLTEQRLRRTAFRKIHRLTEHADQVRIGANEYEDFMGFPLSAASLDFLSQLDAPDLNPALPPSTLMSLSGAPTQRVLQRCLQYFRDKGCPIEWQEVNSLVPWSSNSPPDTTALKAAFLSLFISQT